MSKLCDGVLVFECPKCREPLEVGLHITAVSDNPENLISAKGIHYGHPVGFTAEAPHMHAELWGHLVRCHQPNPHPYISGRGSRE